MESPGERAPPQGGCQHAAPRCAALRQRWHGADPVRRRLLWAAGAVPLLASASTAGVFPAHAVRIVVPYAVGVGPDVVARSLAERLSARWGHPVLVDNKPGASGIVAFSEVRKVAPDGHTLFLADTATMAVNPLLHPTLPYDPARDLVPLSLLFRATFLLWVGGASRFRTLEDMMAVARSKPGGVSYATLGNGHASHVAVESFARAAGLQLLHVPFKDAGALFTAVARTDVDFTTFSMNTMAALMAAGRVRPLAVAAARRLPALPMVPTLSEAGGPDVEMHPWAALTAVAGTPAPVLRQLQRDIVAALGAAELRARAASAGFEITPSTPGQLRARVDADVAQYAPLVAEGRIARM
jgi:tripartite-type tricarboxylate transporter receptor subunit TctC